MPKKGTKKKTNSKKTTTRRTTSTQVSKELVKNLVQLQKVHTDLAEKFDKLSREISSLLTLFELAARSFSNSPAVKNSEKDTEFLMKVDMLLEQNKTIAKGLTLMEEKIRERMYGGSEEKSNKSDEDEDDKTVPKNASQPSRPLPKF